MKIKKKLVLGLIALMPMILNVTEVVFGATSDAFITFTEPSSAPPILNPDNPDEEATEDQENEGNPTGEIGTLTLDFVSNFNFGEQELSSKNETYYLENETTPFAQVTDVRGTGDGWRLVAELSPFSTSDSATSLPGATIVLNNTQNTTTSDINSDLSPSSSNDEIVLDPELGSTPITTAGQDEGMGTWLTTWEDDDTERPEPTAVNESVALEVPAAVATEDDHSAEITWTLYNTPNGTEIEDTSTENEQEV